MPRALLGGVFTPDGGKELLVEVFTSGRGSQGQPTCESRLSSPLIPGLPDEFAHSVVGGLVGGRLSGGRVIVDRAAFDPVESSPMAFGLAAGLLSVVLESLSEGRDVERVVRDVMKGRS